MDGLRLVPSGEVSTVAVDPVPFVVILEKGKGKAFVEVDSVDQKLHFELHLVEAFRLLLFCVDPGNFFADTIEVMLNWIQEIQQQNKFRPLHVVWDAEVEDLGPDLNVRSMVE
eukprot:466107_1